MKRIKFVFFLAFILVGCKTLQHEEQQLSHSTTNSQYQHDLAAYFPADGSTASYQGEGNEFASYTLQTKYIDESTIAQIENNGGVTLLKVYRITNYAIELVYMEAVDEMPTLPSAQKIATLPVIEIILQQPLEVGRRFNGWDIVSTKASLTTEYSTFHDVIELRKITDNITTSKYFAKGVGLVLTKDEMLTTNGESFIISSTLQKIE